MTTVTGPSRHGGPDLHSYSLLLVQITTWLSTPLTEIIDSWRDSTKKTHKTHKTTPPHIMCSSSASDHIHFLLKLSLLYQEVIIWNQPKLLQGKSPINLPYPCLVWSPPKKRFHLMTPVSFPSAPTSNHVAIAAIPRSQSHSPKGPRHLQIHGEKPLQKLQQGWATNL